MTDYGHELLFGTFVTPSVQPVTHAVDLAVVADRAGIDLVTFQDHPYQPRFHDTWTLLSYVASRTERVRVSGNVLNLPLRQPAVLARAAASLDLLSGGRFELGIGAGGFWDAIEAMGGRRLTPGQAVDALEEAITVIREIWAAGKPGGVRVDGEYYKVKGAKRGPAPAHDIGVWVGAYKPKMLALTGRVADGWLPSLGYLKDGPDGLRALNSRIDDAAASAGRDPSAVRRLLNIGGRFAPTGRGLLDGPPEQWAEELAELTLEHGISAFILATDDATTIERYAAEVAPATRALIKSARQT
ncbi:LLM class flavin-dependent oxidoreductase [Micromonospora sp. CPCC 205371]|nr:LLM class flavin-dependent oxidoreductase [Micromonospora sp. CPCC 205371]